MKKKITNLEMLCIGMNEIARNHNLNAAADEESIAENFAVCIFGGCNVPTLCDVEMLCEDVGIDTDYVRPSEYGIDVYFPEDWWEKKKDKPYKKKEGMEMWRRAV